MTRPKKTGAYGTADCPRCETPNVLRQAKNGRIYQDCQGCGHRSFWGADDSADHIAAFEARAQKMKEPPDKAPAKPKETTETAATESQPDNDRDPQDIWA